MMRFVTLRVDRASKPQDRVMIDLSTVVAVREINVPINDRYTCLVELLGGFSYRVAESFTTITQVWQAYNEEK